MSHQDRFDNNHNHVPSSDDEHGNNSMEAPSGDNHYQSQRSTQKNSHIRLTKEQNQVLEEFFKNCSHPNDTQRKELGRRLSIDPLRVKFWFQNKRAQIKKQTKDYENVKLGSENQRLRAEIMHKQAAALNNTITCSSCGPINIPEMSFEEQLRMENARLREELNRMSAIATKYIGLGRSNYLHLPADKFGAGNPLPFMAGEVSETEKDIIMEVAATAMEELIIKAQFREPLWVPILDHEILWEEQYHRIFSTCIGPKRKGFEGEASRESGIVFMNHTNLVEILMDANKWLNVFCGIVSKASTLEVLSTGVDDTNNGRMQVMSAEYHVASPLVPTREISLIRYSKQFRDGTWAVVDVSFDHLYPSSVPRCRRRPSGCIIQDLHTGRSKVTWVEHLEVDNEVVHNVYKGLVNSGLAFGAKRWVATLVRKCDQLATTIATIVPKGCLGRKTPEGRTKMLKVAERMVSSFCNGAGASTAHRWTTITGSGQTGSIRVMTLKSSTDDMGRPSGVVLSAAISVLLPVEPTKLFIYLLDLKARSQWDNLSNCGLVQEIGHIAYGFDACNCVSLLQVNSENSSKGNMLILQDSSSDPTGLYLVYAPVLMKSMYAALAGGDPDHVPLLPSGFAIHPAVRGLNKDGIPEVGARGSLLTVAFQMLDDPEPASKLSLGSVASIDRLLMDTVKKIKSAMNLT